jgi:hypothetical protein
MKPKVLFICGSINQTTQMHQVAAELGDEVDAAFTPYYCDGLLEFFRRHHMLETTVLGEKLVNRAFAYLQTHDLPIDYQGRGGPYDLVVTCSDLVVPKNIRHKRVILVQEGMTDPENFMYHITRLVPIVPRWFASTSTTGLSLMYDRFCVASEGYRELFIHKGIPQEKLVVTGIPNFDDCARYLDNDFPFKGHVLVCTSDVRETYKFENRRKFIKKAIAIANGRPLFFKLHPNEFVERAVREIKQLAPEALIFTSGNTEEMIANCSVLITRYSSTVYVGLALGKECYSDFDIEHLKRLMPMQNASAARNIAEVCREVLDDSPAIPQQQYGRRTSNHVQSKAIPSLAWGYWGRTNS